LLEKKSNLIGIDIMKLLFLFFILFGFCSCTSDVKKAKRVSFVKKMFYEIKDLSADQINDVFPNKTNTYGHSGSWLQKEVVESFGSGKLFLPESENDYRFLVWENDSETIICTDFGIVSVK
jgi:hypothetical protein